MVLREPIYTVYYVTDSLDVVKRLIKAALHLAPVVDRFSYVVYTGDINGCKSFGALILTRRYNNVGYTAALAVACIMYT